MWKADTAKIIVVVDYFCKMLHLRCLTWFSEYPLGSEYTRVLNMPRFWIYRGSECARVLNMALVLNMSGFGWCQDKKGPEYAWIIPEYPQICLNILKYVKIGMDMPKSTCMDFALHVHIIIPCLLECMINFFNKSHSLKEHETVFLKRQNVILFVGWKYLICFLF